MPALPALESTSWYPWAQGVDQAARTVFSVATPTGVAATDTAAVQAAIDSATAAGGGIVQCQCGTYAMNAELVLKDYVLLRGQGKKATVLSWASDLGAGKYAVKPPASPGIQQNAPAISDLWLTGPSTTFTMGTAGASMDGWRAGRNVNGSDVTVTGFRAGIVIIGDHNVFNRIKSSNNHYNVLYASAWTTKGNQTYVACDFTGATFASVAAEGANVIDSSLFTSGHVGFAPYGFYKFDAGSASTAGLLSNTVLNGLAFEAIGNASILDESTGTGSGLDTMSGATITTSGTTSWDATYKIAARDKNYAVKVRNVNATEIIGKIAPFTGGDVGDYFLGVDTGTVGLTLHQDAAPIVAGAQSKVILSNSTAAAARVLAKTFTSTIANTTPQTLAVPTRVGDLLVAVVSCSNDTTTVSTPTGGTGLTWTLRQSITATTGWCNLYLWTAQATTQETATISFARSAGTGYFKPTVMRFSNHAGVGASSSATGANPSAASLGITTTKANSAVVVALNDWNVVDGSGRLWRTGAGAVVETVYDQASAVSTFIGYHADAGAVGAKTVGLVAPATMKPSIIAVEVLPY